VRDEAQDWKQIIAANGLRIQDGQFAQLSLFHDLLIEWNARVNLVSRKDESKLWPNHILHSISLLFKLSLPNGVVAADIGSGGGLPGLPLAIMLPEVEIVLIESIKKKCAALSDIVSRLRIGNARVVNGRAEDIGTTKTYANRFDVVLARAVAPLRQLITWSVLLVRKTTGLRIKTRCSDGLIDESIHLPVLVALKGGDLEKELAEAKRSPHCRSLWSCDVQFEGIQKTSLVDKKIVIISLIAHE